MQESKDNFSKMAGNSLRNFDANPPDGMWERIEGGMARRRRKILFFRYSSIAASVILLIGLGITYLNSPDLPSAEKLVAEKTDSTKTTKTTIKGKISPAEQTEAKEQGQVSKESTETTKKSIPSNIRNSVKKLPVINNHTSFKNLTADNAKREKTTDLIVDTGTGLSDEALAETKLDPIAPGNVEIEVPPAVYNGEVIVEEVINSLPDRDLGNVDPRPMWGLALGYGLASGADFSNQSNALTEAGRGYTHDDFTAAVANETSYFEEIENTIHDAPLSFGFIVNKNINLRFTFETGITYTKLKYRVKTDELEPYYREYRNELNYIGIPAGLRYSLLWKRKFEVYALQWAVIEKGISGVWHTDIYSNDQLESTESNRHKIRGIQLSSVSGIGIQYSLRHNIHLFGQGGVQVFFLNQTQPYNLRSTHKAWPSIQTGLRMSLNR